MPNELPEDPMTELAAGAVQMHELFMAYVYAGFSEAQSMTIICTALTAHIRTQNGE